MAPVNYLTPGGLRWAYRFDVGSNALWWFTVVLACCDHATDESGFRVYTRPMMTTELMPSIPKELFRT